MTRVLPHHFASHLIGKIKPDADAFQHVTDALKCEPQEVIFLDDNDMNVVAARSVGIEAVQVRGIAEAQRALLACGVLENSAHVTVFIRVTSLTGNVTAFCFIQSATIGFTVDTELS